MRLREWWPWALGVAVGAGMIGYGLDMEAGREVLVILGVLLISIAPFYMRV